MKTVIGLLLIGLLSFLSIEAQPQTDANQKQAPGKKLSVGDYRLYINCIGTGSPTVVLEAGFGNWSDVWGKVMPEVGKFTRVCAYDRANLGNSDPAPKPRNAIQIINDLHTLLEKSGEKSPFVLVGHSFGGVYNIFYAHQYPKQVSGMVLVDSSHEDQPSRFDASLTPQQLEEVRRRRAEPNAEGVNTIEILGELSKLKWRTRIPLYVLSHGVEMTPPGFSEDQVAQRKQIWLELQKDHSTRSPKGKLIIAEKSGHYIQTDQPELVIDAIRQVILQIKGK